MFRRALSAVRSSRRSGRTNGSVAGNTEMTGTTRSSWRRSGDTERNRRNTMLNEKLRTFKGRASALCPPRLGSSTNHALVRFTETKTKEGNSGAQMRVSFHARVLRMTGWKLGDHIDMEFQGDGTVTFFQDRNGRILYLPASKAHSSSRPYVKFTLTPELKGLLPLGVGSDVETEPGLLACRLPE